MNISVKISPRRYVRSGDVGWKVPNDGYRYFRVKHAVEIGLEPRNSKNPMPAVAHKFGWGTTTSDNRDYLYLRKPWQLWFAKFIDTMTGGLLPRGKFIGYYKIKKNPDLLFHDYSPGTLEWVYSRMYQDAVWATDAGSFTTGSRDYFLGLNLNSNEDWQYLSGRPTTGSLLRLNRDRGSVLRFDCLDSNKEPPEMNTLEPWMYYWCTQEHPDGSVTRFPHFASAFMDRGWNYPIGTASPLIAPEGWVEMKKNVVEELSPGTIWQPYFTP